MRANRIKIACLLVAGCAPSNSDRKLREICEQEVLDHSPLPQSIGAYERSGEFEVTRKKTGESSEFIAITPTQWSVLRGIPHCVLSLRNGLVERKQFTYD